MMSIFDCSVHCHCTFCDGKSSAEDMAAAAYKAGVRFFGMSCHSHTPVPHDEGNVLISDLSIYRGEMLRLKNEYDGRMEILTGIEWDSQSLSEPEDFDYWIGSVHNLRSDEAYYCIDWDREKLTACRDDMFRGDAMAMVRAYYEDVASVAAKKPDILGHIDLITKLNGDGSFFDENSSAYKKLALSVLEAADPSVTLLEINTGAVCRGYRSKPYPALFILQRWREMGGSIIISSDAHSADNIVFGYEAAAEQAKMAGFKESAILSNRGIEMCAI